MSRDIIKPRKLSQETYKAYVRILQKELIPATGCTEPIAIAYAAAKATEVLAQFPNKIKVECSGNVIKNVKAVNVPHSGGMHGIAAAAILGTVGGDANKLLNVLLDVTEDDILRAKELLDSKFCRCEMVENVANLYVKVTAMGDGDEYASVVIENKHDKITEIKKNGETLQKLTSMEKDKSQTSAMSCLNLADILTFAAEARMEDVAGIINAQIKDNMAISEEGLKNCYGLEVGRNLLKEYGSDICIRARARAAAGSDARMSGCPMPVVINSGSGNQGMTVSLPVIEYAIEGGADEETLIRALLAANLISLHQKRYIGSLSAYCGATSAAAGAVCGIAYLQGADAKIMGDIIINTTATIGGMVCDGAKPSCAAKISAAIGAALDGYVLAGKGLVCRPGEGIVGENAERTIENIGRMGREGMRSTDKEILNIMMGV
ncbi:MAG: L-serine ammonia-lyase, iron-sulfur-dependent, subunit alpha [Oscillospiraceae bacterium]